MKNVQEKGEGRGEEEEVKGEEAKYSLYSSLFSFLGVV